MRNKRILVWPDWHLPRHHVKATAEALYFAKHYKPDVFVHLGDMFDDQAVSSHPKNPARPQRFIDDRPECWVEMARLCKVLGPKCEKHITLGNHEEWLQQTIWRKAPELDGLIDLDDAFGFKKFGFKVTPRRQLLRIGKVYFSHDIGGAGPSAADNALKKVQGNIVQGHNHRLKVVYETNARGKSHFGCSLGWLGDAEAAKEYMNEHDASTMWTHAFGTLDMEKDGSAYLQVRPIFAGSRQTVLAA